MPPFACGLKALLPPNPVMTDFPHDLVLFDLDGTLLETHRDLGMAVNHALALGDFAPVPLDEARHLIGGGAKAMLRQAIDRQGGLPDEEFHALYKRMLAYYGEHFADQTRPYPHAARTLEALRGRGVRLGVVTNKFEPFARGVIAALDLDGYFGCIVGGDTLGKGKAKPEPDLLWHARDLLGGGTAVFVGDSSYDAKAARAADMPFVAALYGYCDEALAELPALARIDSLDALIPALTSSASA